MDRFKDKVVIVTGAASGIGEATTRRIVSEGGTVVLADFAKEKMTLLTQELKNEKAEVYPVYFSAENLESCRTLIELALENTKESTFWSTMSEVPTCKKTRISKSWTSVISIRLFISIYVVQSI